MDSFRNPKLAASLYASQQEERPVLAVGSSMDIGDYPGGQVGDVHVFTNADEVALYKNGVFVSTLAKEDWKGLSHGPMRLDDTIGSLLETQEGFEKPKAELLKKALLAVAKYGMGNLPKADLARFGYAMVRYKMTFEDGAALYKKYVGNWGGEATVWRFDALKQGKVVSSVTCGPSASLRLEAVPSHMRLREGASYDVAAIRIRITDEFGNPAPYAQLPVSLQVDGPAELVGPHVVTAEGGMCGTYIRTIGRTGEVRVTLAAHGLEPVAILFNVEE